MDEDEMFHLTIGCSSEILISGVMLQVDETDEDEMEERQEREDAILQRAADIRRTKAAASRTGWQEPKRPKGHWEHLLEEMQWMAKEFAKYASSHGLLPLTECGHC